MREELNASVAGFNNGVFMKFGTELLLDLDERGVTRRTGAVSRGWRRGHGAHAES